MDSLVYHQRWLGVDEAGRGPLAGPVTAAAVILPEGFIISGLNDSKKLSDKQRQELETKIKAQALRWSVGWATVEEIDALNILRASQLAMRRAVAGCGDVHALVLIDGPYLIGSGHSEIAIVKGDAKVQQIAAASILAKEARDREMKNLDKLYPGYGLAKHMGYPTKSHVEALKVLGVTPIHRKSFGPVKACLSK